MDTPGVSKTHIYEETLEAISFEVAVITLPRCLREKEMADFQDFYVIFSPSCDITNVI